MILESLSSTSPQDRYLVCPDMVTAGAMRLFAHAPNYFMWGDKVKRVMARGDGL